MRRRLDFFRGFNRAIQGFLGTFLRSAAMAILTWKKGQINLELECLSTENLDDGCSNRLFCS